MGRGKEKKKKTKLKLSADVLARLHEENGGDDIASREGTRWVAVWMVGFLT